MRIALLFGGRSGEHEISVMSARSIFKALVNCGFDVLTVGITKDGRWTLIQNPDTFFADGWKEVTQELGPLCYILPDPCRPGIWIDGHELEEAHNIDCSNPVITGGLDVDAVFPVLHGSFGEDGTIQGLLDLSGLPYVGSGTLASSVCMDKDTAKIILSHYGIPCVPYVRVERYEWRQKPIQVLEDLSPGLTFPVFVKPSGSGSSLGVSKVKGEEGLCRALEDAFLYDTKALIEPAQEGYLEIECAILGNNEPKASVPGQIVPSREFYDYEAKYIDENTRLIIPAALDDDLAESVKKISIEAFKATGCSGLARVDVFVNPRSRDIKVSEINTMPGFTEVSMYPKLWEASGMSYEDLVATLVDLAFERKTACHRAFRRVTKM